MRVPAWGLAILCAGVVVALVFALTWIPNDTVPDSPTKTQRAELSAKADVRATVLQVFAGLVVAAGLIFTARTVYLSRQTHLTDRFTKAVDQLGHSETQVRMGGLYALERLALDSEFDRPVVLQLVTRFLHVRVPVEIASGRATTRLDPDVQTALDVIQRVAAA